MKNILYKLRIEKGYTQQEIAKKLNISQQAYQRYENTDIKSISFDTLMKFSEILNINLAYLLGIDNRKERETTIPVFDKIPAGIPIEELQRIDNEYYHGNSKYEYFAFKFKGDSMSPEIIDNDILIIRKQDYAKNDDLCLIMVNGFEGTIRKVKYSSNGLTLIPLNKNYKEITYSNEQVKDLPIKIIGIVIESRRTLKI